MTKKNSKFKRVFLIISLLIVILFLSTLSIFTFLYFKYDLDIEKLTSLNNGVKVYSATGFDSTLYNTNRSVVEISTLPEHVKNAFIDIEDKRFYSHNGYDLKRIIKSLFVNFTTQSKTQGASTISQQLVKNALLSNEKTYYRKIKELILSIKMEKQFDKNEILEMYLNTIYFGSNAYGIENASKTYFNKSASELSVNEACCLAGIIKSPSYYSPKNNYENARKRKNLVANKMLNAGDLSYDDYNKILNSEIKVATSKQTDYSYEREAIYEATRLLQISERELINKKYQIITFKDDNLQKAVEESNNNVIRAHENALECSLDSLSIVANNNGQVLAYYSNSNYDLHNLKRQPASTLKPLAVYLPCFQKNILTPATLILDEAINYNGFSPKNADKNFHGYVSTRYALSHSLNIPSVKALDYLGFKKSKTALENLGINISNSDLNLSLALGAVKNGVKILDLVSAYSTLANLGEYSNLCFVSKILNEKGNEVYNYEEYKTKVFDEDCCFLVNDILKDCAKTGTAKRLASLNLPVASKTGTASNEHGNTDLFNVTYSTEHTMLTWVADINKIYLHPTLLSSSQPTDINKGICEFLYKDKPPKDFACPSNIEKFGYDLVEYENNHIIVQPLQNKDRYIAYDYFKTDFPPQKTQKTNNIEFVVNVDQTGATISFETKRNEKYKIIKQTNNMKSMIKAIENENGCWFFKDNDVFQFDNIEYYITDDNDVLISEIIKIRPKDYLINYYNNEILSKKKKWLV